LSVPENDSLSLILTDNNKVSRIAKVIANIPPPKIETPKPAKRKYRPITPI